MPRTTCRCGQSSLEIDRLPKHRFLCHCTICQGVYGKPFGDIGIVRARDMRVLTPDSIGFRRYKTFTALRRGLCRHCGGPVLGLFNFGPGLKFAMVPSETLSPADAAASVAPEMHIFYKTRVADIDDALPKIEGSTRSMAACVPLFLDTLRG